MPLLASATTDPAAHADPGVAAGRRVETILLATDLTSASSAATNQAIDLAIRLDARLLLVTVMEPAKAGPGRRGVSPEIREARNRQAHAIAQSAWETGAKASYLVWEGDAGDGIIEAARAEGADLIVVGTHSRTTVGRFILGSVSDHVVHRAGCAVLVVRPPDDGPPDD